MPTQVIDALVVGAGLSGLTVAYHLQQAGKRVVVLEARERIGGRILTVSALDGRGAFDLGPTWYWSHHEHVTAMLRDFGLGDYRQYEAGDGLFERGPGALPVRIAPEGQQPVSWRFTGGASALVEALVERIPDVAVHLRHVVRSISLHGETLLVKAMADGALKTWTARHAVVTLPPHLAATTIDYSPPLPRAVEQALRATPTWMGEAMKVALVYERPFWRDQGLSGLAVSYAGPVQQFHDATPFDQATAGLFGWIGNHNPVRGLPDAQRREAVVQQVVRLFGEQAASPIHYAEMNWEREAFTTNRTDPQRVIAEDHPSYGHPLLQLPQMDGRLWWATTEASPVSGGYLDGAIFVGRQVASKIVEGDTEPRSLQPPTKRGVQREV